MEWYLKVLRQYADFSGRARRKEYWFFFLFNLVIAIALSIADVVFGTYSILSVLYSLGILLPSLAVVVRRLHDVGKSGVWIFIAFIPIIGAIWLLFLMVKEGVSGENNYGPDPKEEYTL
jgi:uncharacterized membrane protein YhaH (DUF805 family)